MKTPQRPEPLDSSKIHHPNAVRAWKDAEFNYHAAVRAQKLAADAKAEALRNPKPKVLTEDEEYRQAVARDEARKAVQAERAQREAAKEKAHQEYLSSSPEQVELLENSLYALVMALQHWVKRGYEVVETSINAIPPSLYVAHLIPAPKSKKTA